VLNDTVRHTLRLDKCSFSGLSDVMQTGFIFTGAPHNILFEFCKSFFDFWSAAGVTNGFVAVPLLLCAFIRDSAAQSTYSTLFSLMTSKYFVPLAVPMIALYCNILVTPHAVGAS